MKQPRNRLLYSEKDSHRLKAVFARISAAFHFGAGFFPGRTVIPSSVGFNDRKMGGTAELCQPRPFLWDGDFFCTSFKQVRLCVF